MADELGQPTQNSQVSDSEIARRMNGWMQIGEQAKRDAAMQQALIMFGAHMMQPVMPWDTTAGAAGRAIAAGAGAYGTVLSGLEEEGRTAEKHGMEMEKTKADITHTGAQTAQTRALTEQTTQTTRQSAEKHPVDLRKVTAEAEAREVEATILRNKIAAGIASPAEIKRAHELEIKKAEADIAQSRAAAAASGAAARASGATAALKEEELQTFNAFYQEELAKEKDPTLPLAKAAAKARALERHSRAQNKSITGEASAVQVTRQSIELLKAAYPGQTEAWYAQEALNLPLRKAQIAALQNELLMMAEDDPTREEKVKRLNQLLTLRPGEVVPPPAEGGAGSGAAGNSRTLPGSTWDAIRNKTTP